jgi:CRISPR-associated protein Cas1
MMPENGLLIAWQERKHDEIEHPFLKEKAPLGLLPHLQAQLLAGAISMVIRR